MSKGVASATSDSGGDWTKTPRRGKKKTGKERRKMEAIRESKIRYEDVGKAEAMQVFQFGAEAEIIGKVADLSVG